MGRKVFVSYCHKQGTWVWDRLVPILTAGGSEVLIDRERFEAGKAVVGQMDAIQDRADVHVLLLSADYLRSSYCVHEMRRAVDSDPLFKHGKVVPVTLDDCRLPPLIKKPNPLHVDLRDDAVDSQWDLLLDRCGADLGTSAPAWLNARDDVVRRLRRKQSVNLVVEGRVAWRELIAHLARDHFPDLTTVDLQDGKTVSRRGLISEILRRLGYMGTVPPAPEDLSELARAIEGHRVSRVAVTHFDLTVHRADYDVNLFSALRHLVMESRKLVLLIQSRQPFASLLPREHPLSEIDVRTVEIKGRT